LRNNGNDYHVFVQISSEPGLLSLSTERERESVCMFDSVLELSLNQL